MGELLLSQPLFPGESGIDQLVEIIKVLGTPSEEQIALTEPTLHQPHIPSNQATPALKGKSSGSAQQRCYSTVFSRGQVFRSRTPPEAIDLISHTLQYDPNARLSASDALVHPFFDELRNPDTKMANGKDLPMLFDFTEMGKWKPGFNAKKRDLTWKAELSVRADLLHKLVPPHCYQELLSRGIDIHNFKPIPLDQLRVSSLD